MRRILGTAGTSLAVFSLVALLALPTAAQAPADSASAEDQIDSAPGATNFDTRWLPWMGCWQLWEEQVERAAGRGAEFPDRTFVCMTPTDDGVGALLSASADGRILVERTLVADGIRREVTDGECQGWEERSWSSDGRRLFTRAELQCAADPQRQVSGISLFSNRSTWVDMQLVEVENRQHLEIRRYNPVTKAKRGELVGNTARLPASAQEIREARGTSAESLGLPDVREAAQQAEARVVEAMLAETEPRLALDSDTLIELDDAGIDGGVIDLLVALAYPEQFVVERRTGGGSGGGGSWTRSSFGGWGSPYYSGRSALYDPIWYRGLYPYYITPLGYGGWASGYSPYFYGGAVSPFIALQGDEAGASGRAVNGRGYTRVVPRTVGLSGGGRVPTRRGDGGSTNASPPRPGGSSSGGGAGRVTSGGYSRGGGGGGGRTAVPRR